MENFLVNNDLAENKTLPKLILKNSHIVSGLKARIVRAKFSLHLLKLANKNYGLNKSTFKMLKDLIERRKAVHGNFPIKKWAYANSKYFWTLYTPGYQSQQLDDAIVAEMSRIIPNSSKQRLLRFVHFAITKKCPSRCEHCFEWDNINKKEVLSYDDLHNVVLRLKETGISQLHLSGGEPMLRVNEIVKLCEEFRNDMEFWIVTSGFNLTFENAVKLKQAGVTGVIVSLDHYDENMHNIFRQSEDAFKNAVNSVKFSREVDMAVAVSLCATKVFISEENLMHYADFVKSLDVSFIQLLEPKAVGHYAGKDVKLNAEQQQVLEDFFLKMNYEKAFGQYPIVVYHGYYQRRVGCFTSGNRGLYIDTNADVLACPFCHVSSGNALKDSLTDVINRMRSKGCADYGIPKI